MPSRCAALARGCGFALLIGVAATGALAQVQPDAGSIQEQLRAPALPRKPAAPRVPVQSAAISAPLDLVQDEVQP